MSDVNTTLTTLLGVLGITPAQLGQALISQGVLVDVKVGKELVTYTKADGTTIQVTPKQAAHYAKFAEAAKARSASVDPATRALREQESAEFRAFAAQRAQARVAAGKFATTLDRKVVNRSVAELVRRAVVKAEDFASTVEAVKAGTFTIPEDVLVQVQNEVNARRSAARKASKTSK